MRASASVVYARRNESSATSAPEAAALFTDASTPTFHKKTRTPPPLHLQMMY